MVSKFTVFGAGCSFVFACSAAIGGSGGDSKNNPNQPTGPVTAMDAGGQTTPLSIGAPIAVVHGVQTALPTLPELTNVTGTVNDDSVQLTFDPVDGAMDYRIYVLPKDSDIHVGNDPITIKNATYRCAGETEKSFVSSDDGKTSTPQDFVVHTAIESAVDNYTRAAPSATLGYVYAEAGDGLVPVYGVGSPDHEADGTCDWAGYDVTRVKKYTSSKTEYDMLVSQGWRDDGIKFYVPATATDSTLSVSTAATTATTNQPWYDTLYFTDPAELAARASMNPTTANFVVLKTQATGTQPLMRFHYSDSCNKGSHDELVVGKTRFENLYHQGNYPATALTWSGIPASADGVILVVEALASGCPYQGMLAASHIDATVSKYGSATITHEAYVTLDEMRAASPSTEVFVNGQADTKTLPKAVARTFVKVTYQAPPKMDFWDGFHDDPGFTLAASTKGVNCSTMKHYTSAKYELSAYCTDDEGTVDLLSIGPMLGQFWDTFSDAAQDANGKIRIQPKQAATLNADSFLHATMAIDSVSTGRRYPQILISDQFYPVQENMSNGMTVVFQTRGNWPPALEIQVCDHTMWDVNAQCPHYAFFKQDNSAPLPPIFLPGDRETVDRTNQYDVFVSTKRAYFFFDGRPYGCANLPAGKFVAGPESVTFADVLYHSGADVVGLDIGWMYDFHVRHLANETRRHYDNLGFSSGVTAPTWDEKLIPCQDTLIPE